MSTGRASAPPQDDETALVLHRLVTTGPWVEALVVVGLQERLGAPALPAGVAHPALRQLRGGAPGYVRQRRWRRRRAIGQRGAVAVLGAAVLAAVAALVLSDTAPPRDGSGTSALVLPAVLPARARIADRSGDGLLAPKAVVPLRFGAAAVFDRFAPLVAPAPDAAFRGAWAVGDGTRRWVAFPADARDPFLVCTRAYESDTAGGYRAVDPARRYYGAYQFEIRTWDSVARRTGRRALVGVNPATASPRDQDWMALYLYRWQGARHWNGRCSGL